MKILIIGGGGREHALAWKCAQSPLAEDVIVAPGNAGTAFEPGVRNAAVAADDIDGLLALARREAVDLTIVGPEVLVAGMIVSGLWPAMFRSERCRSATRRIKSIRQAVSQTAQDSHRRLPDLHRAPGSDCLYSHARCTNRHQGRRAGCRQGCGGCAHGRGS
jgi:hypothetical protein